MRKILSIICYIAASFFVYMVTLISFVVAKPTIAKLAVCGSITALALFFLLAGLLASRFHRWQRDAGIVFLAGSLLTLFVALAFACALATPEFTSMFPEGHFKGFRDFGAGFGSLVLFLLLGGLLLRLHHQRGHLT